SNWSCCASQQIKSLNFRYGSKADIRAAKSHVRFTPESGHVQCSAVADVRYGPKADIVRLFDHLVGALKQRRWDCESKRLRGLVVNDQLEPRCLSQRQVTRPSATQDFCDLLSRVRVNFRCGRAVGHEAAGVCEKTKCIYRGQVGLDCEVGELLRPGVSAENDVRIDKQRVGVLLCDRRELRE